MPHEQAPANEVPVEAAYAAAESRIIRMTKALILSEGQALVLQGRLAQQEAEIAALRRRLEDYEGGDEDAAEDEGSETCGEADTAHAFSD